MTGGSLFILDLRAKRVSPVPSTPVVGTSQRLHETPSAPGAGTLTCVSIELRKFKKWFGLLTKRSEKTVALILLVEFPSFGMIPIRLTRM